MAVNMPVTVRLEQEQMMLARQYADTIMQTETMKRSNYTGLHAHDRFYTGYLGEFGLAGWLKRINATFTHHIRIDGRPNHVEFSVLVPSLKLWRKVESKCAGKPYMKRFMMPASQYQEADVYIGSRCISNGEVIQLWGWLPGREVMELPVADFGHGVPTRWCYLDAMRGMDSLGMWLSDEGATQGRPAASVRTCSRLHAV